MDIRQIFKSAIFWISAVVIATGFFVAALGAGKTFQAETDILLLPKNDWAVRNIEQILGNAKQIPRSLSFYDKLLEKNSDIEDAAMQLPDAERKQAWNEQISIERVRRSGVLKIKAVNEDQLQAEIISRQTATDLIFVMGKYYAVADLGMKKIDGPITAVVTKNNFVGGAIAVSLALGFLLALLLQFLLNLLPKNSDTDNLMFVKTEEQPEQTVEEKKPFSFPRFSFPSFGQSAEDRKTLDFNIEEEAALVAPIKNEMLLGGEKKAAAPANLPIAEEQFSFDTSAQPVEKTESAETIVSDAVTKDINREATPEEVKERLNKLLSGGIFK